MYNEGQSGDRGKGGMRNTRAGMRRRDALIWLENEGKVGNITDAIGNVHSPSNNLNLTGFRRYTCEMTNFQASMAPPRAVSSLSNSFHWPTLSFIKLSMKSK